MVNSISQCSIIEDGVRCPSPVKGHGWCNKHYYRWRDHGDPEWQPPRPAPECAVDGCDGPTYALGYCERHYGRFHRWGDPNVVKVATQPPGTAETYHAVHDRMRSRDKAANHPCVDCGRPARDWSYDYGCADERVDPRGHVFCLHPEHYSARCTSCHRRYDRGR